MAPKSPVPVSILVALGITAGCDNNPVGPCLDFPVETGGSNDTGDTGEAPADEADQSVLDRGVLPQDVEKRIRERQSTE